MISWYQIMVVAIVIGLVGYNLDRWQSEQRKASENFQKGIDEINRQLSEILRKIDGLR
jgi:uncharacterized membrane-anchored protein YhcB (DUF1043 family)